MDDSEWLEWFRLNRPDYAPCFERMKYGPHVVYAMADRDTLQVRYVGVTNDLAKRRHQHSSKLSPCCEWMRSYRQRGLWPIIVPLQVVRGFSNGQRAEKAWIKYFAARGAELLNKRHAGWKRPRPTYEANDYDI